MTEKLNAYFFLRENKNGNDSTIYLRIIHKRRKKDISLKLRTDKKWDPVRQRVKGRDKEALRINEILDIYRQRIYDIQYNAIVKREVLTIEKFVNLFFNKGKTNFFNFAEKYIATLDLAKETKRTYKGLLSKIKQFSPELYIEDIDISTIMAYREYLIDRGNNPNTTNKALKFFRNIINQAVKAKIIEENPFEHIKLKSYNGNREYLTVPEIKTLYNFYQRTENPKYKRVLQYFLFNCYVGLRYTDLKNLRWENIKETIVDNQKIKYIEITMHKTKHTVTIPLLKTALEFLPEEPEIKQTYVFKVYTNQVTNRILHEIAAFVNLRKSLTTHIARHTFATLAVESGVPIETVSELLGHTQIKTTQIYAKISMKKKVEELMKVDNKKIS